MAEKEVVIVTGSSGLIGSALIEKLAGHFALAGFDKVASRLPRPAAECVCIDLTSEEGVNSLPPTTILQVSRTRYTNK
jgi:nucleoside-diphosphate-sugar epimerase